MVIHLLLGLVLLLPVDIKAHVDKVKLTVRVGDMKYDITDLKTAER